MISFKPGVRLININPHVAIIIAVVGSVYQKCGYDCVVTSVTDGAHRRDSKHYDGMAVDFRLNDLSGIPAASRRMVARLARAALAEGFDVLHEFEGTPSEHLHVEYDPKENPAS